MALSLIDQLLASLRARPKTLGQLAQDLGVTLGLAQSALQQLRRGNYVDAAHPGADHCGPACGSCSMTSMCSNADSAPPEPEQAELWRLTPKGERRTFRPLPVQN